jgi:branched-chain amino acid aminotransferase
VAVGTNIKTYFDGAWHDADVPIMRAADHGAWQGTTVFDGARYVDGVAPDLLRHCERVVASARALMLIPAQTPQEIFDIVWEGLAATPGRRRLHPAHVLGHRRRRLRHHPRRGARGLLRLPRRGADRAAEAASRLTTTQFHRPVLTDNVCNAKAGCLYPNNARMLAEARATRGTTTRWWPMRSATSPKPLTANVFMVRDGTVFTPDPQRHLPQRDHPPAPHRQPARRRASRWSKPS